MCKRSRGLLATVAFCFAFVLLGTQAADAQVSVNTDEGWSFTFTGNVNSFLVYETESDEGDVTSPFALVGVGREGTTVRTGLLPAFATFEAAGTEGDLDLGVHFGFAPQIQTPGGHDNFAAAGAGAMIDMREAYMTIGGDFGQILAGRALGVFQRQNILTDQTLFGVGATGGNFADPAGTTLGRIGYGYVYPNYNAQIAYSTPAENPAQLTVALFDPDAHSGFNQTTLPRLESEFSFGSDNVTFWAGGLLQRQTDTGLDESATSAGATAGLQFSSETFSLTGSGYYGSGIGTTLMFLGARSAAPGSTELRPSYGFLAQGTATPAGSDVTLGLSYGQSTIEAADDEPDFQTSNSSVTGGVYLQATESLKVVGESTYAWSDDDSDVTEDSNTSIVLTGGLMLFF